jgi:glucan phosphoethanolaminetransferase (alkaline phosphatase superfamily)
MDLDMNRNTLSKFAAFFRRHDLLVSVFVILALDLFFIRGFDLVFELVVGLRFWVNFIFSTLVLLSFLAVLRRMAARGLWHRIAVASVLALVMMLQDGHFFVYREYLSSFGIRFFFENPTLIAAGTADVVPFWRAIALGILVFSLPFLWRTQFAPRRRWQKVGAYTGLFVGIVVGMPFLAFFWYSNASHQVAPVAFASALVETGRTLHFGSVKFQKPKVNPSPLKTRAPNIVWIIGESLSGGHIGIFGYERDTTPHLQKMLEKKELVAFSNTTSIGVHTMISVPYLLTGLQGSDPHGEIYRVPTIFDYAVARGYDTHFLSAQDTRWGNLGQFVGNSGVAHFLSGTQFNPNVSVHKGADDMLVLERGVKPALEKTGEPFFLVVQMDGSHYPYAEHSPPEFKKFLPEGDPNSLNAYDNTVLYSDHYFHEIVKSVRARDPEAWIFYVSDHGENMTGIDGMFHFRFGRNIIHVPMFVWPPLSAYATLQKNAKKPTSQVDMLATTLEIMEMAPVTPIDGMSLLSEIPENRLRVVSKNMATMQPHPSAALVYPDLSFLEVDYSRWSVVLRDRKTVVPFSEVPQPERVLLERRVR